jgi:hypothetical protein
VDKSGFRAADPDKTDTGVGGPPLEPSSKRGPAQIQSHFTSSAIKAMIDVILSFFPAPVLHKISSSGSRVGWKILGVAFGYVSS